MPRELRCDVQAWLNNKAHPQLTAHREYLRCLQQEQLALDRRLRALEQQPRPAVLPPFPHRTLTPEEQEAAASRRLALAAEEGNQISVLSRNSQLSASPASSRSLKGSPGGSSIGSDEVADSPLQPDVWAMGSQDGNDPLRHGLPAFGCSEIMGETVQAPLLPGRWTSGVRKRLHRWRGLPQQ
ncbi:hypothetical protein ACK3TF_002793 [Chlorella vulgaris]